MPDAHGHDMPAHGTPELPAVLVDSYNVELREAGGFIGDRASSRAFRSILDDWRDRLRRIADDPLGNSQREGATARTRQALVNGDVEAAGLVLSAIEEFAQSSRCLSTAAAAEGRGYRNHRDRRRISRQPHR
jgi:hypothetical protein